MEELNLGPPNTNPICGRVEDLNPGPPDYKSRTFHIAIKFICSELGFVTMVVLVLCLCQILGECRSVFDNALYSHVH